MINDFIKGIENIPNIFLRVYYFFRFSKPSARLIQEVDKN